MIGSDAYEYLSHLTHRVHKKSASSLKTKTSTLTSDTDPFTSDFIPELGAQTFESFEFSDETTAAQMTVDHEEVDEDSFELDDKLKQIVESFNDDDIKKFEIELTSDEPSENMDTSQLPESYAMNSAEKYATENDNLDTAYDSMSKLESTNYSDNSPQSLSQLVEEADENAFDSILSEKNELSSLAELPSYSQLVELNEKASIFDVPGAQAVVKSPFNKHLFTEGNNTSFEISNLDEDLGDNSLSDEDLSESVFQMSKEDVSNLKVVLWTRFMKKKHEFPMNYFLQLNYLSFLAFC